MCDKPFDQLAGYLQTAMVQTGTTAKCRSPVIDWEKLKKHGVQPSFCLPSSHNAVRAHVSSASIREVCRTHPRREFRRLCDREAVVIPVLLNQSDGTNVDNQAYRAHVEGSRRCLGASNTFALLQEETDFDRSKLQGNPFNISTELHRTWVGLLEEPRQNSKLDL